jgi:protein involved in polysaccharide export with SLBB domain
MRFSMADNCCGFSVDWARGADDGLRDAARGWPAGRAHCAGRRARRPNRPRLDNEERHAVNKRPCPRRAIPALLAAALLLGGCEYLKVGVDRWFDPSKVIRKPARTPINPILPSATLADETEQRLANSEFPREEDYVYSDADYILGPSDVISVGVLDLYQEGQETVVTREITESGRIDLPLLEERIVAEQLTKEDLKEVIKDRYKAAMILPDPEVSVTVLAKRNNVFSVLGSVARTGQFGLTRKDTRLLEALAMAGGVTRGRLDYLYVIRPKPAVRSATAEPRRPAKEGVDELPDLPEMVPPEEGGVGAEPNVLLRPPGGGSELEGLLPGGPGGEELLPPPSEHIGLSEAGPAATTRRNQAPAPDRAPSRGGWIYSGGRWVRVEQPPQRPDQPDDRAKPPVPLRPAPRTAPAPNEPPPAATDRFGWREAQKADMARIIAIDYRELVRGNPRMNIVIRNHDVIQVPRPVYGEFYLMGEVGRPGVYSLTERQITLKQAIAAGGNFGALSWPENCVLWRRVGSHQEQAIPLNLQAIFRGEAPDIYLKPDDVVAVGTNWKAIGLAVLRNAFRFSYGFAFIYDRNFADPAPRGLDRRRFQVW